MPSDHVKTWRALDRKLIAILRGVEPSEVAGIVDALLEEGFRAIEIPLNSPDPFASIEIAVARAGADVLIGAGTVLSAADARRVGDLGGGLVVSPNTDPAVIQATAAFGLVSMPGCYTATEALLALSAGATALKFFPASLLGPDGVRAIRAVLPPETLLCAVGGVADRDFGAFAAAGVAAFGLGSSLYKPGASAADVRAKAAAAVAAYDALTAAS